MGAVLRGAPAGAPVTRLSAIADVTVPRLDIGTLYAECLPRVYGFAFRMLGDRDAALDVAGPEDERGLGAEDGSRTRLIVRSAGTE
jgi:hypothetical protein